MTRISDEAVEVAAKAYWQAGVDSNKGGSSSRRAWMRAALEAALPHLTDLGVATPHLVVDREALIALQKAHRYVADSNLGEPGCACGLGFPGGFDYIEHAEHVAGRVLSLLGRES